MEEMMNVLGTTVDEMQYIVVKLGDEKYGIWATILSFISWIYYCDLGIGNGLRNKLASTIVIGDKEASKKYLGQQKICYFLQVSPRSFCKTARVLFVYLK